MDCEKCGAPAAYTRKYSGQSLCSPCFSSSIMRKTAKTISRHKMISHGDLVAVGVSGGKDSLALLHVLHAMSESHRFEIRAVTIDEGIPGYRDEALGIVDSYCSRLGVPYDVLSYRDLFGLDLEGALEARQEKTSSCSICGTLRRRALDVAAERAGADSIATAHNLDDNIQTCIINMLSGEAARAGLQGPATGESPRRIKPFADIYEAEIVFYAYANGIPFQAEQCPHAAEGIRTEVRQFLNRLEEGRPGIKNNLHRSSARLSEMARAAAPAGRARCPSCGGPSSGGACSACLTAAEFKGRLL